MSLSTDLALTGLQQAAAQADNAKLDGRLAGVGRLLGEDLAWLERNIQELALSGLTPASDAARHLVALGGKRVRPMTLLLSAACFEGVSPAARELSMVVELVHSATLLHDDVIDDGQERRGARTARLIWGNAVSVLGGDFLLVQALLRTQQHAPELLPDLLATLQRLVDGEIVQLRGRAHLDSSEATYDRILHDKTASLFRFATLAGSRLGGASIAQSAPLLEFGEAMGVAFQLVDDALDYVGEGTGKTLFADLREGKVTLPLVLAVQDNPTLLPMLQKIHQGDESLVLELRQRVAASGACSEVRRRAREQTTTALKSLQQLRQSPARALLEGVALELANRSN